MDSGLTLRAPRNDGPSLVHSLKPNVEASHGVPAAEVRLGVRMGARLSRKAPDAVDSLPKREERAPPACLAAALSDVMSRNARRTTRGAAATPQRPPTEIKMQKAAFSILGALLIAGSMVQMAAASEHHMRNGRGYHRWDRAYDQLSEPGLSTSQMREGRPVAHETRSCDKFWCYPD